MTDYKYIIVGGGMTADAAVRGIRQVDENGSIGLFSMEKDPPYNRPPLSKGLWKGKPIEKIWRNTDQMGADLHLNCKIEQVDVEKQLVMDNQGQAYRYNKLLLATGGRKRSLPGLDPELEKDIFYFRTLEDYRRLRQATQEKESFAVIGGSFIGSEIGAALEMNGRQVSMIYLEPTLGSRIYPADLSNFISQYYTEKGVKLYPGQSVTRLEKQGEQYVITTSAGKELRVDGVVAGVGIQPNTLLARQAGLELDEHNGGILVSPSLETSRPNIYSAGDVASFFNPIMGTRMRVEHEDNANTMGQMAGQSMAGDDVKYEHLPYFYSDLFDLGYEAVGKLDPSMEIFADWQEPYQKGVLYYLDGGRVRGVLLWNVWSKVDAARQLIAAPGPFDAASLKGKLS